MAITDMQLRLIKFYKCESIAPGGGGFTAPPPAHSPPKTYRGSQNIANTCGKCVKRDQRKNTYKILNIPEGTLKSFIKRWK